MAKFSRSTFFLIILVLIVGLCGCGNVGKKQAKREIETTAEKQTYYLSTYVGNYTYCIPDDAQQLELADYEQKLSEDFRSYKLNDVEGNLNLVKSYSFSGEHPDLKECAETLSKPNAILEQKSFGEANGILATGETTDAHGKTMYYEEFFFTDNTDALCSIIIYAYSKNRNNTRHNVFETLKEIDIISPYPEGYEETVPRQIVNDTYEPDGLFEAPAGARR